MTHEQKPESAEFRTQKWDGLPENQANDGWHWLTHEITNSPTPYLWKASSNVWIGDSGLQFYPNSAWCARRQYIGRARVPAEEMAEQRREDAEGADMSFAWLVEDVCEKDKGAPPLARFDMLFGDDEISISEAREKLKKLGIESLYISDEWGDALEGNELSRADVDALPPLHEDEQKAGWRLASAWDTEDGTIIRHYVRPLRTPHHDPTNVAALEARGKDLEAQIVQSEKRAFNHGYLIACCNISHLHDEPSIACDVLAECGLSVGDVSTIELSDYDAEALSQIRASRGDRDPIREGGEHV